MSDEGRDPAAEETTSKIDVPEDLAVGLLGASDVNLRTLEAQLPADVHVRGNRITLRGAPADVAAGEQVIAELIRVVRTGTALTPDLVRQSLSILNGSPEKPAEVLSLNILSRRGKTIRPKTLNQKHYVDAIDANTIVFGLGPAGTGRRNQGFGLNRVIKGQNKL